MNHANFTYYYLPSSIDIYNEGEYPLKENIKYRLTNKKELHLNVI